MASKESNIVITELQDGEIVTSAAQKARAERNRQRARALREARLVQHSNLTVGEEGREGQGAQGGRVGRCEEGRALLSGGGFLLPARAGAGAGAGAGEEAPRPRVQPPAPIVHPSDQPHCLHCERPFPQSYLYDTFDYSVCDECRDDEGEHSLITRTEAKSEFLLKDCDLDARAPALRCVRRRNPHRARFAEMRLYLRAQVEARALAVWGSAGALQAERALRRARAERAAAAAERRRLRALRMDVRSSLFDRTHAAHDHAFGPETHDEDADCYSRVCTTCGFVDTYEKM